MGAGPTGLAVALMLARQGRRVVVHERFEAARPVGAGFLLQPTGQAVLDALGLTPDVEALSQPVRRLFGTTAPTGRIVLDVLYDDLGSPCPALGVHRAALFDVLHRAALAEGVTMETGCEVVGAEDGRLVRLDGSRTAPFDLVVDGSGAGSRLAAPLPGGSTNGGRPFAYGALWATVPWPGGDFDPQALEQVYRGAEKMIGVLPVGRRPGEAQPLATFFWSLRAADHPAWVSGGLAKWRDEVASLWPRVAPTLQTLTDPEQLTFARYRHHTVRRPVGDRLAVIGDAAHATSPQLGQGVNMGLLDAHALADALDRHADLDRALAAYAAARRWHVRLYQALSLTFTPFYQADGRVLPWVRDHLLGKLARLPFAPRLLAATVSGLLLDPRPGLTRRVATAIDGAVSRGRPIQCATPE